MSTNADTDARPMPAMPHERRLPRWLHLSRLRDVLPTLCPPFQPERGLYELSERRADKVNTLASLFIGNRAWFLDVMQLLFFAGIALRLGWGFPGAAWKALAAMARAVKSWAFS